MTSSASHKPVPLQAPGAERIFHPGLEGFCATDTTTPMLRRRTSAHTRRMISCRSSERPDNRHPGQPKAEA